ncbi:MAG: hypothetical protein J2O48_06850 [Solirubrobacterales bacterium]|nr:hypothetical protein [Solirubrobacterales bacterium]
MKANLAERRAARLVRLYPRAWRERYGDELLDLLVADIEERPRAHTRTLDVVRCALPLRIRQFGTTSAPLLFALAGLALWAQMTISWRWEPPANAAARNGMLLMFAGVLALGAGTAWGCLRRIGSLCRSRRSTLWLVIAAASSVTLVLASVHFGHAWPGTGGHPWHGRELVPSWLAAPVWAATLWISTYWAHPGALAHFPATVIVWMLAAPALIAVTVLSWHKAVAATAAHVVDKRNLVMFGGMFALAAGAATWILAQHGPPNPKLPAIGLIDLGALFLMISTLTLTWTSRLSPDNS